jgi:hypothetical protein
MFFMNGNNHYGIVIQERDRHLLQELAIMRVIDRDHAKIVAGFGSVTRVNTRLLALTRAGLLRRYFLGATAAGRKALYALSTKGAAFIGVPSRGPRRRKDEVLVADFFVSHQLIINGIYCALKYGDMSIPGATFGRWISFYEPVSPQLRLIPDGYFELENPSGPVAAFLEVDFGHERLAAWKEKIRNYLQLALSGDFERRFGQNQFRVLIIANSERSLLWIRKTARASTTKVFWFTTMASIDTHGFFGPIWFRPTGDDRQPFLTQSA